MSLDAGKSTAAYKAVEEELLPLLEAAQSKGEQLIVGIGSGSTVVFVVEAITKLDPKLTKSCIYVPTSFQAKHLILDAGLTLGSIET
jgi:ribose 5-phosphate isomerase A